MENATHALYMVFAVMIFVLALTVSITSFNKAKATADIVLYREDESNYYDYLEVNNKADENRYVGLETIIPTLYKYYKENYTVVFKEGNYDEENGEFTNWRYLPVMPKPINNLANIMKRNWQKESYTKLVNGKYGENVYENLVSNYDIFSFDLDEETLRHEPWTGSYDKIKNNLDCFLKGGTYINPNNNTEYINYSAMPLGAGGFIAKYKNSRFIETIEEYNYKSSQSSDTQDGSTLGSLAKSKNKRMIIFTKIN